MLRRIIAIDIRFIPVTSTGLHSQTLERPLGRSVRLVNRERTKVAFRLFSYRAHECVGISGPSSTSTRRPQTQRFGMLHCSLLEKSAAFISRRRQTSDHSALQLMK